MNIIGITGSSGAGKSTICDILEKQYDVRIINADKVAKKLSKKGTRYVKKIAEKFGEDILDEAEKKIGRNDLGRCQKKRNVKSMYISIYL